jgi:hypothetical protein
VMLRPLPSGHLRFQSGSGGDETSDEHRVRTARLCNKSVTMCLG